MQKKPRGNGDHLDIIRTSLYSYKLPITNLHYLVHQRREIGTLEGFLETGHLIEDTPESPYVTLGIVGASLTLKRSKVILIQVFSVKIVFFFSPIRQSFPLYSICMNVWHDKLMYELFRLLSSKAKLCFFFLYCLCVHVSILRLSHVASFLGLPKGNIRR